MVCGVKRRWSQAEVDLQFQFIEHFTPCTLNYGILPMP